MSRLSELCKAHTELSETDIVILKRLEEFLPIISDATDGDVFIDCKTRDPNVAIVVAEHRKEISLYKETVVGKFAYRENEPAALRTLDTGLTTNQLNGVSQENVPIEQSTTAIKNGDLVIGVLIIEKDITRDFIEKNTLARKKHYGNLGIENIDYFKEYVIDGLLIFDEYGYLIYCNSIAENFYVQLGYRDNIIGMAFKNLTLEPVEFEDIIAQEYMETNELLIGEFCVDVKYSLLSSDKKVVVLIRDVTEIRNKKQELISKSVVIQEIHHRVKNNLQTIASLIRMQSRRIDDPRIKMSHQESINRILSIAVTHEILAKNISGMIDVHEMIILLIQNTIYQGDGNDKIITVDVEGDKITVDSNKATSIALIVNELMSNAFEHAFKNRKEGNVTIHIQKKTLISTISVIDNGEGFPQDVDKPNSFGLSIVKGLAKETLKGDVVIDSTEKGTNVTFSFLNK